MWDGLADAEDQAPHLVLKAQRFSVPVRRVQIPACKYQHVENVSVLWWILLNKKTGLGEWRRVNQCMIVQCEWLLKNNKYQKSSIIPPNPKKIYIHVELLKEMVNVTIESNNVSDIDVLYT